MLPPTATGVASSFSTLYLLQLGWKRAVLLLLIHIACECMVKHPHLTSLNAHVPDRSS